jgi:hypothetical protein
VAGVGQSVAAGSFGGPVMVRLNLGRDGHGRDDAESEARPRLVRSGEGIRLDDASALFSSY